MIELSAWILVQAGRGSSSLTHPYTIASGRRQQAASTPPPPNKSVSPQAANQFIYIIRKAASTKPVQSAGI